MPYEFGGVVKTTAGVSIVTGSVSGMLSFIGGGGSKMLGIMAGSSGGNSSVKCSYRRGRRVRRFGRPDGRNWGGGEGGTGVGEGGSGVGEGSTGVTFSCC